MAMQSRVDQLFDDLLKIPASTKLFPTRANLLALDNQVSDLLKDYFTITELPTIDDLDLSDCMEEEQNTPPPRYSVSDASFALRVVLQYSSQLSFSLSSRYSQLGAAYYEQGLSQQSDVDLAEAMVNYKMALKINLACTDEDEKRLKSIAKITHQLGKICCYFNFLDLALLYYLIELKIRTVFLSITKIKDGLIPVTFFYLGNIYNKMGDHEKAIRSYRDALTITQNHFDESSWLIGKSYYCLALIYQRMGQLDLLDAHKKIDTGDTKNIEQKLYSATCQFNSANEFFMKAFNFYSKNKESEKDYQNVRTAWIRLLDDQKSLNNVMGEYISKQQKLIEESHRQQQLAEKSFRQQQLAEASYRQKQLAESKNKETPSSLPQERMRPQRYPTQFVSMPFPHLMFFRPPIPPHHFPYPINHHQNEKGKFFSNHSTPSSNHTRPNQVMTPKPSLPLTKTLTCRRGEGK